MNAFSFYFYSHNELSMTFIVFKYWSNVSNYLHRQFIDPLSHKLKCIFFLHSVTFAEKSVIKSLYKLIYFGLFIYVKCDTITDQV